MPHKRRTEKAREKTKLNPLCHSQRGRVKVYTVSPRPAGIAAGSWGSAGGQRWVEWHSCMFSPVCLSSVACSSCLPQKKSVTQPQKKTKTWCRISLRDCAFPRPQL